VTQKEDIDDDQRTCELEVERTFGDDQRKLDLSLRAPNHKNKKNKKKTKNKKTNKTETIKKNHTDIKKKATRWR
jgi:predicted RNA-binding protein with RPS1 domain